MGSCQSGRGHTQNRKRTRPTAQAAVVAQRAAHAKAQNRATKAAATKYPLKAPLTSHEIQTCLSCKLAQATDLLTAQVNASLSETAINSRQSQTHLSCKLTLATLL